jgi:hypothetical protein
VPEYAKALAVLQAHEEDTLGCELWDIDRLLEAFGYTYQIDRVIPGLRLYTQDGWQLFTFQESMPKVPPKLHQHVLYYLRGECTVRNLS